MTHPEPAGYVPPPGMPLITQADCWRRQRETLRALGEIIDAHPDLPAITWTVSWLGGVTGDIIGLGKAPEETRAIFTVWQKALRLEHVKEAPIRDTGIVALSGHTYRSTVRVALTARAYYPLPDDGEPSETRAPSQVPGKGGRGQAARGRRDAAVGERGTMSPTRPDHLRTGPLIQPSPSEAIRSQHTQ
jgi:hypothetical protein